MPSDNPPIGLDENLRKKIRKILVADDTYENRYLLEVLLGASGYQVISVENGQEALETLKTEKIDAIISDILMPILDGFMLCRKVKEDPELVHIPFIFYSAAYTEQKDREFGLSLGADEYVTKPIEPEDFLDILKGALERAEQGAKARLEKILPDNLSYYISYSEVLGRKLDKTVVESDQHRELARFNEEKYRLFLQNLQGIGYLIQIGESIPLIIEGQVEVITGYPATEFLSGQRRWLDILHPEDQERYLQEKTRFQSPNGDKLSHQYRIIHNNGEIRWVHEIASVLRRRDSDILQIQGAVYDITRQKQAEEQIRISEEHYRTLFETMVEGVTYQDKSGNIIDANPSAERILGLTIEEMQGRTSMDPRWKSIHDDGSPFPGEDHPAMVALRTGLKNSQIMGVYSPRDNRHHWIMVNAVPQFLPGEEFPNQVYTTLEDITQEKDARDHIEHLNRILKALRMVNFLITGETKRDVLLNKICSSLVQGGGYPGIWFISESESGRQVFQEISDPKIRDSTFNTDINQGNIHSWMNAGRISDEQIISHSTQIITSEDNSRLKHEGYGVMITRLSYEDVEYGTMCVCIPDPFLHDPEEESLFLEIARDVSFALHHIHVLHKEEAGRNALLAREKQYRELVETISDTIFTLNSEGVITYISPAVREITSFDPSHYIGKKYLDFVHIDDRDEVDNWFKKILLNHIFPIEFRIVNTQGQIQYIRVKGTPVKVHEEVVEVTGILSDITVWKESEKNIAEHTKEVQTLLSLHLFTHENEKEILQFTLQAALDITHSEVGFLALISEGGKKADVQIWSPEGMNLRSLEPLSIHEICPLSGLWSRCLTTKKPVIVNDYESQSDSLGYLEGHVPIFRFIEVPILDGEKVTAIIAVANRIEPYSDAHAHSLNTLGNTLWEIIHRRRSDQEIKMALTQISQNMEQLATLNDTIRNPLTIIALYADSVEEQYQKGILQAVHDIDEMVNRLDQGWVQSEKVKRFLIKHYQFKEEEF
ncbi:MAG: PAS domain S-box protein [Methanobacteriota archaeon]